MHHDGRQPQSTPRTSSSPSAPARREAHRDHRGSVSSEARRRSTQDSQITGLSEIMVHPSPPPIKQTCPEPLKVFAQSELAILDPTGARTRLFNKTNLDRPQVGDILLVRFKSGDPFAGVCINIRRRGVDTAILLRNQLTRVGVELWAKIYSPTVTGIEVVQRKEKRARRAKLYYMRYMLIPTCDGGND